MAIQGPWNEMEGGDPSPPLRRRGSDALQLLQRLRLRGSSVRRHRGSTTPSTRTGHEGPCRRRWYIGRLDCHCPVFSGSAPSPPAMCKILSDSVRRAHGIELKIGVGFGGGSDEK
jgi:hypothetical protein